MPARHAKLGQCAEDEESDTDVMSADPPRQPRPRRMKFESPAHSSSRREPLLCVSLLLIVAGLVCAGLSGKGSPQSLLGIPGMHVLETSQSESPPLLLPSLQLPPSPSLLPPPPTPSLIPTPPTSLPPPPSPSVPAASPLPMPPPPSPSPGPVAPSPSPPPPPRPSPLALVVAAMNTRYETGSPDRMQDKDDLSPAGVLVHTFDAIDGIAERDRDDLWNPCPPSMQCSRYEHVSASVVSRRLPHYFNEGMPGLIISSAALQPASSSIRCAFAYDAGTMGWKPCPGQPCSAGGTPDYCHWLGSEMSQMLKQHIGLNGRIVNDCGVPECRYNEVVIRKSFWLQALPSMVEAVFFPAGSTSAEQKAKAVVAKLRQTFGSRVAHVPLVSYEYNFSATPQAFKLVDALHSALLSR